MTGLSSACNGRYSFVNTNSGKPYYYGGNSGYYLYFDFTTSNHHMNPTLGSSSSVCFCYGETIADCSTDWYYYSNGWVPSSTSYLAYSCATPQPTTKSPTPKP